MDSPQSSDDWLAWLERERARAGRVYRQAPTRLISDVHREEDHTTGYRGREIVELLQNADDAGEGLRIGNQVAIVLSDEGLCVANTGLTFSDGGVESLMVADNSPKRLSRSRFIGNKGLGFRSVLSWSACPVVTSGALAMAFSRPQAERWLAALCEEEPDLLKRVEDHREETGREWPVPVLAVPFALDPAVESGLVEDHGPAVPATLAVARGLRAEGYDTVIALPFVSGEIRALVEAQLKRIGRDALLFTRHLSKLEFRRGTDRFTWTVERGGDELLLSEPSGHTSLWRVHTKNGEVSAEHWGERRHAKPPTWEVKLAVPEDVEDIGEFLYCFFPTQVRFPFPVVAHATVELTQNRQNLVHTAENRFVVGELATALVELAAGRCSTADSWGGLRVVAARVGRQLDPLLEQLGLTQRLARELSDREVVPIRSGGFEKPPKAPRLQKDCEGWLPRGGFEDVALWTDDEALRKALADFGAPALDWPEVRRRLEANAGALGVRERAAIVAGVHGAQLTDRIVPAVLIDHSGHVLGSGEEVFLPPADGWWATLPAWSELRFLDSALVAELRTLLKADTLRDLSGRLKAWKVSEYSFDSVGSHLASRLRALITQVGPSSPEADAARREALATFFALYASSPSTARPPRLHVEVPTESGTWRNADELYFGRGYKQGRLTAALYAGMPERLVASPEVVVAVGAAPDLVAGFVRWAGAATLPRDEEVFPEPAYKRHVACRLHYPVNLGDVIVTNPTELESCHFGRCRIVSDMASILDKADPEAILAWIAEDQRFAEWEKNGEALAIWPVRKHYSRNIQGQRVTAYALWMIASTAWMPTEAGVRRPPSHCLQHGFVSPELRRILPVPVIRRDHAVFEHGSLPQARLRLLLTRAGVVSSLAETPVDDCLDLVLDLPQQDPEGRAARALYREVVSRQDGERPSEAARKRYLAGARLRGVVGTTSEWYRIKELLYDDVGALPPALRKQIPLLDLDTKRGAAKVKDLLGVSSVDAQAVRIEVTTVDRDPRQDQLVAALSPLRPYILCLAPSQDAETRATPALRDLNVVLSRRAAGTALVGDRTYSFEIREPGERIGADGTVYLVGDPNETDLSLDDPVMADRIGLAVSSAVRFEASADIARLVTCAPRRRLDLLAQICGWTRDHADGELTRAAERLNVALHAVDLLPFVPPEPPPSLPPEPAPPPPTATSPLVPTPTPPPIPPTPLTSVQVTPTPLPTPAAPRTVFTRVKATTRAAPSAPGGEAADPVEAERLASFFEEAEGRFPLPVAHVQGKLALGCDVVSFRSAADREAFRVAARENQRLVDRFIEVKARSSGGGTVELRGNELARAEELHDRYWLYRLYKLAEGKYELVALRDPLGGATRSVVEVDLFRSRGAAAFLVEGISSTSASPQAPAPAAPTEAAPPTSIT